jgi:hypothetical protein
MLITPRLPASARRVQKVFQENPFFTRAMQAQTLARKIK